MTKPLLFLAAVLSGLGLTAQCATPPGRATLAATGTPALGRTLTLDLKGRAGGVFLIAIGGSPTPISTSIGSVCVGPTPIALGQDVLTGGSRRLQWRLPLDPRFVGEQFSLQAFVDDAWGPGKRIAISNVVSDRFRRMPDRWVDVAMRDKVKIRTFVSTPSGKGPWPVVLKKGYQITTTDAATYTKAGYVYVSQGVRSGKDPHGLSGDPRFFADGVDGYDTIAWIARQPWCDGKVAMVGPSYWAATQWLAAANPYPGPPPALKAIIPSSVNPDFWERSYRAHGALNLSMTAVSRAFSPGAATFANFMRLPLRDLDRNVGGKENTFWNECVGHGKYNRYWEHIGTRNKYQNIKIPVYLYAGWWDYYSGASLRYFNLLRRLGHTPEIRVRIDDVGHKEMPLAEAIRWLDWVLKGRDRGIRSQKPVSVFVQGENKTRTFDHWPPRKMWPTSLYLSSPKGERFGRLHSDPPVQETPSTYSYDPRDPVPSIGGNANHRELNKRLKNGAYLRGGSFDQRAVESRKDVLVFTTEPLEMDLTLIGPVKLHLFASTDGPDMDFTAVLMDVEPGGKALNVTEGIVRGRFRESIWNAPKLLQPNRVYPFEIEMLPTARVFKKGHRIRLHVSSSRFPLWDRNTNTGKDPATDTTTRVAKQTIYHDAKHPSHLVLPVIFK